MQGIRHATLSDQVLHALQHDIISQHFRAGEKLSMCELKKRYRVGATPIREALSRLSADIFIEAQQQRGFHVKPITAADCRDLCTSMQSISTTLISNAMQHHTQHWEQNCQSACQHLQQRIQQQSQWQWQHWHSLLRHVHSTLLQQAIMPLFLNFENKLHLQILRYQHALTPANSLSFKPKQAPLEKLMHAITTNNEEAAQAYFQQHYAQQSRYLLHQIQRLESDISCQKTEITG